MNMEENSSDQPKRRRRPNNKQRQRQKRKEKKEEEEEDQPQQPIEGKKEKKKESSKKRSRSRARSHSRSRSGSHSHSRRIYSSIADCDILHEEIKKPNLNRSDFQEMEALGGGNHSAVELAVYIKESKYVALKILDKKEYERNDFVAHAFSEKQMLRQVESPFKIKYLGSFQTRKYLFLVTEYVEGQRLIDLIQKTKGFDEDTCRFYAAQLVLFLETLHSKHALFRDFKPENILVSHSDRYLKVIDFGYSTYLDEKTGYRKTFCGTLEYNCPEKVQGFPYNYASDIWSFGILLFVMLCDKFPSSQRKEDLPKNGNGNGKLAGGLPHMKRLHREIPELLALYFKDRKQKLPLSEHIQELVSSMLSFDPERRPTISKVKQHRWFHGMDWKALAEKKIIPPDGTFEDAVRLSSESAASSPWKDW